MFLGRDDHKLAGPGLDPLLQYNDESCFASESVIIWLGSYVIQRNVIYMRATPCKLGFLIGHIAQVSDTLLMHWIGLLFILSSYRMYRVSSLTLVQSHTLPLVTFV